MALFEKIGDQKYFSSDVRRCLVDKQHEKLISILKSCENLSNAVEYDGTTLLHLSARFNNEYMTRYLINENVNVNAVDNYGDTPLLSAILGTVNEEIWKILLDAGSDLWNIKNGRGQCVMKVVKDKYRSCNNIMKMIVDEIEKRNSDTADIVDGLLGADYQLHHLEIFKEVEITKLMIERGCLVNLQDSDNRNATALHVAAKMNDLDNVKVLLQHGADKNIVDWDYCPPVVEPLLRDNPNMELIKMLLPDSKNWTEVSNIMQRILANCKKEALELLIQHYGINLGEKWSGGQILIYHLMDNEDTRVWDILDNVDVNAIDGDGDAALHAAVWRNNVTAVRFLLSAGANVNSLNNYGQSPLFCVNSHEERWQRNSHQECIELLLEAGADAQLVDRYGGTIVSVLIQNRCIDKLDPILMHLAIREAVGVKLNIVVSSHIDSFAKDSFAECRRKIGEMKDKSISGTITFIKFLMAADEKIWKYVRNDGVFEELSKIQGADYLHRLLVKRFERAVEVNRLHLAASEFIAQCIEPLAGNHEVLDKILDFLSFKDWELIATCTA